MAKKRIETSTEYLTRMRFVLGPDGVWERDGIRLTEVPVEYKFLPPKYKWRDWVLEIGSLRVDRRINHSYLNDTGLMGKGEVTFHPLYAFHWVCFLLEDTANNPTWFRLDEPTRIQYRNQLASLILEERSDDIAWLLDRGFEVDPEGGYLFSWIHPTREIAVYLGPHQPTGYDWQAELTPSRWKSNCGSGATPAEAIDDLLKTEAKEARQKLAASKAASRQTKEHLASVRSLLQ